MEAGKVDGVEGDHRDGQQETDELAVTRQILSAVEETTDTLRREVQGNRKCYEEDEKEDEEKLE